MEIGDVSVEEFMGMDWGEDSSGDENSKKDIKGTKAETPTKKKKKRKRKLVQQVAANFETKVAPTPRSEKLNEQSETHTDQTKSQDSKENKSQKKLPQSKKSKNKLNHQEQLNALEKKDPEFYKFLQEEESGLLNFEKNLDLDGSSSEDNDDFHQLPDQLEEASDSDVDVASSDGGEQVEGEELLKKKKDLIVVTDKMLEGWQTRLLEEEPSVNALRQLIRAFHAALVRVDAVESETKSKTGKRRKKSDAPKLKYKVVGASTFNSVVGLCIRTIVPTLAKLLNYFPKDMKKTKKQKPPLPCTCKRWVSLRDDIRVYLNDAVTLACTLLEPSVTRVFLRHLLLLLPYFISFPKIAKTLLKLLVRLWSSSDNESVRVLSFLCITRLITMEKDRFLENTMKQAYVSYVANCKFTSPSTLPMINFMQRTFAEICAVDAEVTYRFAFLYIRQLAVHLRKAITSQSKDSRQTVYNWQFVHSIALWCRVLSITHPSETLQPLIYPLVQVAIGTIELVPTARYFPLRFHIVRSLVGIGDCTNTYIPLLNFILAPLHLKEFSKKQYGVAIRPLAFDTILKMSNSQLKEKSYRDGTMDQVYDLLMAYLNTQAHTVAFPEMTVPTIVMLKKFIKSCKNMSYSKMMKQIVDRALEQGDFITKKRSDVTFSVTDINAVVSWEKELKETNLPFKQHYASYRKNRERELSQQIADKDRNVEERLPAVERTKLMEKSKLKDREEFGELFGESSDEEDAKMDFEKAIQDGPPKKRKLQKIMENAPSSDESDVDLESDDDESEEEKVVEKKVKRAPVTLENEDEDIVEDFHFSDSD